MFDVLASKFMSIILLNYLQLGFSYLFMTLNACAIEFDVLNLVYLSNITSLVHKIWGLQKKVNYF